MIDFLEVLAWNAKNTVGQGYYEFSTPTSAPPISLKTAVITSSSNAVIAEIKAASPSAGTIRENIKADKIAEDMERGGAAGISVITEPKNFSGSLKYLKQVREAVKLPILMKDIIISPLQLDAASNVGANAVLLIQALFDRKHCECNLQEMIKKAHSKNLEILLETHNEKEFQVAVKSDADLIGVNNRNLETLEVDLNVTKHILEKNSAGSKLVVSESGINTPADLRFLRDCGANAFLIGSAIMRAENVEKRVTEFVNGKDVES